MSTGRSSEDEAWRSIVDNYGERASLDDTSPLPAPGGDAPEADPEPVDPGPEPFDPTHDEVDQWDAEPEERFVPPVPPPAPRLPAPVRLAWFGVLGGPALLVLTLLVGLRLPSWIGFALVASFVGGFVYLVATMDRFGRREPWDDGSRL